MAGTLVTDTLAVKLIDNLDDEKTAITTFDGLTGEGMRVGYPEFVQIELVTGIFTGEDGVKVNVEIQGSWYQDFRSDWVSYGQFPTLDVGDDNETKAMDICADVPYLRAVATVFGATVLTNLSLRLAITVRECNYHRVQPGPGFPEAPGTGTGWPDAAKDPVEA